MDARTFWATIARIVILCGAIVALVAQEREIERQRMVISRLEGSKAR